MLNHLSFEEFGNQILITNDLGKYHFLSQKEFIDLLQEKSQISLELKHELKNKYFIFDSHQEVFIENIKGIMMDSKNYLLEGTSLFIFVVTNKCNANCIYCQAQDNSSKHQGFMTKEIAKKAVDLALQTPNKRITIEFQGGEPLMNYEVIQYVVEYSEEASKQKNKIINYSIVSNLLLLDSKMIIFFREHNVCLSTSLDGHETLHNLNRPLKDGSNTFDLVTNKIDQVRKNSMPISAIETTTRNSLQCSSQIINIYRDLKMNSVFIRPLTPLGFAKEHWNLIGYTAEEFTSFYKQCLLEIIRLNKEGIKFVEGHAKILLSKILRGHAINYMELRSPCGAGIGQIAIYYNGEVFTCDEGRMLYEMGDDTFRLGNVFNSYDELMDSPRCKTVCNASVLEALPTCCDCVYQPYCGTCPVINYADKGNIFPSSPHNYRCQIYKGILHTIFEILQENDKRTIEILESWI